MGLGSRHPSISYTGCSLSPVATIFSRHHHRLFLRLKQARRAKAFAQQEILRYILSGIGFCFLLIRNQCVSRSTPLSLADNHHIVVAAFQSLCLRIICGIRIGYKQGSVDDSQGWKEEPANSQQRISDVSFCRIHGFQFLQSCLSFSQLIIQVHTIYVLIFRGSNHNLLCRKPGSHSR